MPTPAESYVHNAPNRTHLWTRLLVEALVRHGVDTFFIAPGSRSTPLTVAVAQHPQARAVVHVDERGTAFAALGYGRATQRPAGWITTSGTAVANGMPAVVEAATDDVPMLLLTADRPPELRDTGANQTIDQVKLFGSYARWQVDLPPPTPAIDLAYVLTTAAHAVHQAVRGPMGPVHVNAMFRKPLDPVPDGRDATNDLAPLAQWLAGDAPYTTYPVPAASVPEAAARCMADWQDGVRGLVVAGRLDTADDRAAAQRMAAHLGWPLVADVTSGLRTGAVEALRIAYADQLLAADAFANRHAPEAVLHLGGRAVSKRLRQYLAAHGPRWRIVVRPSPSRLDPDHRVTHHWETALPALAEVLTSHDAPPRLSAWCDAWQQADAQAARVLMAYADGADALSEPLVARTVAAARTPGQPLVCASSMPVRDMNRYANPSAPGGPIYANRGASGIDGTVATAAGLAHATGQAVLLLIGDLALWHDISSLALLQHAPVTVVVVNNDGGGIFHFLPIAEHTDVFEPYFGTPHGRSFTHAAATYQLPYAAPATPQALREALRTHNGTSALIEVRTGREQNRSVHAQLEQRIADAL
ncbi:2-succinyl-5-enolpyruvyl-6-hydroxy-3-cyclohexene-1-carboxylic-acid synthase [Salisaeta longa]|uniref:2-succinyl-5-enolpyruvyl-6-hydroxy-3- cyclohexene-1-carboxylic-acid synthase n=1 Tax=Salisaeta longa TaxID=503170 RepID=UPI0003B37C42|nr:2-succinyl-5-enolpyruvyl-6-hydroxy-3-cyclohexene-1-carboxylic-acid synthase [Salisaeta longa]